jgi:hypothetical protein
MSNSKISALTSATTPLAGTEVLPIVQSSTTKQVSVANLTAGRTQTSNGIVQGTAATGYNFTANTPAAGMTSQLLNWYEEGTWTPTVAGSTLVGVATYSLRSGRYTRVGRQVFIEMALSWSAGTGSGNLTFTGLPFTSSNGGTVSAMSIALADFVGLTASNVLTAFVPANATRIEAWQYPVGGGGANNVAYDSNATLYLSGTYTV